MVIGFSNKLYNGIYTEVVELDEASKKLEKMGYYENYTKEDFINLILTRRRKRENGWS